MNRGELLQNLEKWAIDYIPNAQDSLERNWVEHTIEDTPSKEQIEAVLIDYINYVASKQGINYGLNSRNIGK